MTDTPSLVVRRAEWADRTVLARLLELYQYDLSEVWPQTLNVHGEYGFAVDRYLRNPRLQAWLFLVDGAYAGFGLVDPDVSLPGNEFWMGQFFVMRRYRRLGIGRRAAHFIFDQCRGRWEIGQMPLNHAARAFWLATISAYTGGRFVEHELHDERWDGWLQCFDNGAGATLLPHDTGRVLLRRLVPADLPCFQAYRRDEDLGRYQGWTPMADADALRFLADMQGAAPLVAGEWFQIGIADRHSDALIGDIGLCVAADGRQAEIGFTLAREAQGRGLAGEAVRAAIGMLFTHTVVARVVGIGDTRNLASIRLLERLGLRRTATEATVFRGEPCLEACYTIERAAWLNAAASAPTTRSGASG